MKYSVLLEVHVDAENEEQARELALHCDFHGDLFQETKRFLYAEDGQVIELQQ